MSTVRRIWRELNRILGQQYHVVVGNPPYITVKDQALNQAYRNRLLDLPSPVLPRCAVH